MLVYHDRCHKISRSDARLFQFLISNQIRFANNRPVSYTVISNACLPFNTVFVLSPDVMQLTGYLIKSSAINAWDSSEAGNVL